MENQDQRKIHAPENHGGVHLCHKCGWPFPNPHPSARHRRAHKRVCGKIEGHKLIDSEESNHSTLSDDEHDTDDDNKNPSPVIVKSVETEKGIDDESEEKLKRSEEDVFSDAVADFSDGKLAGDTKDSSFISEMNKKQELTSLESFKDCEITDLDMLPSTLSDKNTRSQQSLNVPLDIHIDRENMDSRSNVAVEMIAPELKIEEMIERASDPIVSEEVFRLKEGHSARIDPETPPGDMASEVESHVGNKNVHTVSMLDLNIAANSEALLKDFKDDKGVKVQELENMDSTEGMEGEDVCKPLDEILVRESDATETKFIDSDNPKDEQEIDRIPIQRSKQGSNPSDICENNPDTKIEEMEGLEEEHFPMVRKDTNCISESSIIVVNSNAHDGMMEPENSKPSLSLVNEDCSQANSVDATRGSELSGVLIRSNSLADVDECKDVAQMLDQEAAGAEKSDRKMEKAASQNSEKSDAFEPPSFTTLVEKSDSENQNTKEPQPGWFPSSTPVPSDSEGRKKNEELIAKVTTGNAGKQHTPLKNLLDEFPEPENSSLPVQDDGKTEKNNGGTIGSGQGPDSRTTGESAKEINEKEWDSPALEEIKPEKKKGKGRPYWAQFVCCTSADYQS